MSAVNGVAAADLHVRITNHDLALKSQARSSCAECDWTWPRFERRDTTAVPGTFSRVWDLAAEVERLRPVVDAATWTVDEYASQGDVDWSVLTKAVARYRQGTGR